MLDAPLTLDYQFDHVIWEPGCDGNAGFQVDGPAGFQVDGTAGFQVDGTAGFQVAAVDNDANANTAIDAPAHGLFTPAIGSISSAGPALASPSNTLLPLYAGGRYLCQWPACSVSCRRQPDWYRHFQSKHFNIRWFCDEPGCDKGRHPFMGYSRQDKVTEHIKAKHMGSVNANRGFSLMLNLRI
jgi:hypothetical protein